MCDAPSNLEVLSRNKFIGFPDGNILSWCPKMDLLAVSMNKTSIWVFRLNGERVYSINNRTEILDLKWNRSGKFFVVSGTDTLMKVYDANNGKLVSLLPTSAGLPITLTSWSFMDVETLIGDKDDLGDIFNDVFKLDILKSMPKLSNEVETVTLENGSTGHGGTTQTMSDSVITTTDSDNLLDCLFSVNTNSLLSMTFNNLFTVSDVEIPPHGKYLKHATPESLFSQFFLVEDSECQLKLCELKLQIEDSLKRRHLLETIEWCSRIVSIINHIRDQISLIASEATGFLKVLDLHLGNFKDVLYEDVDLTTDFPTPMDVQDKIAEKLTEMVVTALIPKSLKDYWLNQFGERGLARVSSVGNAAYDTARKVLFGQIILALEKLIILLSYLESVAIAETNSRQEALGMSVDSIKSVIKQSQELAKKFYAFIWRVNAEQESFNKFLNWCKVEVIEKLSSEDNDPEAFFNAHPTMEFRSTDILEYINVHMFDSGFFEYVDIDDVNFEALHNFETETTSLQKDINTLHKDLNHNLLEGVQQYIASKVQIASPLTLDLEPKQTLWDINIEQSIVYVTTTKDNAFSVLKVRKLSQEKKVILFPGEIISHQYISGDRMLIFYKDSNKFKLDLVDVSQSTEIPQITSSLEFDESSFIKNPAMLAVNGVDDPSHIIGCVLDRFKKEYVVFQLK